MSQPQDNAKNGARKVLQDCLCLSAGDVVAIFYDETTKDSAELLIDAAKELALAPFLRNISLADQKSFNRTDGLSVEDVDALNEARGIVTCLSSHTSGTSYRAELIKVGTSAGKRLGHMPGIEPRVLSSAVNIDYDDAISKCDDLATAMSLGNTADLETYVFDKYSNVESSHVLSMELGGLDRSPITSTGIIPLGTWGNLPGGETFIAPIENTASGTFVLNGAFKDHVLKDGRHLILEFRGGKLENIHGSRLGRERLSSLISLHRPDDQNYSALAELGVGVNSGISELTGNALFDEKCAGTAHIALGDNRRYGGSTVATIHEDLITRRPSLTIDAKPILDFGKLVFNPVEWREEISSTKRLESDISKRSQICRTNFAERSTCGTLQVRRDVASGRVCRYTVGEPRTSSLLADLIELIPPIAEWITVRDVYRLATKNLHLRDSDVGGALAILSKHRLIAVRTRPEGQSDG